MHLDLTPLTQEVKKNLKAVVRWSITVTPVSCELENYLKYICISTLCNVCKQLNTVDATLKGSDCKFSPWQLMNNVLDCVLICHRASTLPHLPHSMSLTERWIEQGCKTKMGKHMHAHTDTRESRILEPDDRGSYSEGSALNIYYSISRALCRCVHLMFPLCSLCLSHAFIESVGKCGHFAWLQAWLCKLNNLICK